MKRFIKKLLILIIIIAIVTATVNYVYVRRYSSDVKQFASIPDAIQVCNFGSSHGLYGYNYEDLSEDYNCFNFALESQSLSYDYRLFQYYNDHIGNHTVVFISVSYFSLFGSGEISQNSFPSKNKRYYSILPPSLIKEYDYQTDMYIRYFPALAADTGDLIQTLLGKSTDNDARTWHIDTAGVNVNEAARSAYIRHFEKNNTYDHNGNIIENQEEIDALYALIKGCKEKGAVPVLITTPYLHEYTDEIKKNSEDFYDHFYLIINQVVRDTGVEYYDYAFDERFVNEYSWFMDSDHLNAEGAKNFVDILMRDIVYAKGYY